MLSDKESLLPSKSGGNFLVKQISLEAVFDVAFVLDEVSKGVVSFRDESDELLTFTSAFVATVLLNPLEFAKASESAGSEEPKK